MSEKAPRLSSSLRWNAMQRIARQQARETLFGWGLYLIAAAAVLIAAVLVYNSIRFAGESGLNIVVQPFLLPLRIALSLALLYVTVEATLAVARPREQGSLQVLFFAPIDIPTYIGAGFLAGLLVYLLFILLLVPAVLLLVWVTNFVVPAALLQGLLLSVLVAGVAVAFGLFVSAVTPSARSAVLLLVAVLILLLAVQGAYIALLNVPPTSRFYDALQFLRLFLRAIQDIMVWISPFQMLDAVLSASLRADWALLLGQIGVALISSAFWLVAAIWAMRRRGVLP